MDDVVVIVPCGQSKVWDEEPDRGPVRARDAYTGSPFKMNRTYAEAFASQWVILSVSTGSSPLTLSSLVPTTFMDWSPRSRTSNPRSRSPAVIPQPVDYG